MEYLEDKKRYCTTVICLSWFVMMWMSSACYGQNTGLPTAVRLSEGISTHAKVWAAGEALSWKERGTVSKKGSSSRTRIAHASDSESTASSLLPIPRQITLEGGKFDINKNWSVRVGENVSKENSAVKSIKKELKCRYNLFLKVEGQQNDNTPHISLNIDPGSVSIGQATGTNKVALKKQAYRLKLNPSGITITANASAGLYYGVQTLLQLIKKTDGDLTLEKGIITDWPDLELRMIYWDDNHHLERMEAFKDAIRKASFYKINAFALKLNGHFQFKSAKPLVEPYALSPQQYQELTDFAKAHHVQLVPYIDAPAHIAFILKHPEYAGLRAFPNSNYESCVTNPETYELLEGMFKDLFDANKGGNYVFLSTDEPYYVGMADNYQCREKKEAEELGGRGALLAKFIRKLSNDLHKQGRKVIFWGEYPLRPTDVKRLPPYLINAEINNLKWSTIYPESYKTSYYDTVQTKHANIWKSYGHRQFIYTSTQGVEPVFPHYYKFNNDSLIYSDTIDHSKWSISRVSNIYKTIIETIQKGEADLMGTVIAGWGDSGLHPETFWLGYAAGNAVAWNHKNAEPSNLMHRFYRSYYGPGGYKMDTVYGLMSTQAQIYGDSWDQKSSDNRDPIFGNHRKIYKAPHRARDQTIPMLPVPSAEGLSLSKDWSKNNMRRLKLAYHFLNENDRVIELLNKNLQQVQHNRYNIKIMLSIAYLCRQNLHMLIELDEANQLLQKASTAASSNPSLALMLVDQALGHIKTIKEQRNTVFQFVSSIWYQTWFPRVKKANGRHFLHRLDDVKDHLPDRTVDMSYLIYRELNYPLGKWVRKVQKSRNQYARNHQLREKTIEFRWSEYE